MTHFGFDGAHASAIRPARTSGGTLPWVKDATSPEADDGTRLTATVINDLVAALRHLIATANSTAVPGDDTAVTGAVTALVAAAISPDIAALSTAVGLRAPLASPALTGTPTAPTAAPGSTGHQLANLDFVAGEVLAGLASLTAGAPGTLDTFLEAYNRFLTDESAVSTLTGIVAGKQPLNVYLSAIALLLTATPSINFGAGDTAVVNQIDDTPTFQQLRTRGMGRSLLASADAAAVKTLLGYLTSADLSAGIGHLVVTAGLEAHRGNSAGVVIGVNAGASDTSDSIDIGFFAGAVATGFQNVRVGRHAGYEAHGDNAVQVGHAAGQYAYSCDGAVIIGYLAGRNPAQVLAHYTFLSVIIGNNAAQNGQSNQTAVIIGANAGLNATNAPGAVMIGYGAGQGATNADKSVLIGNLAGSTLNRNNSLVIESNPSYAPAGNTGLIYGEFDTRRLVINGALQVVGAPLRLSSYTVATLPTGAAGDMTFVSNGRKNGEGAGAGTGVPAFYDSTAWRAVDTGATVAA